MSKAGVQSPHTDRHLNNAPARFSRVGILTHIYWEFGPVDAQIFFFFFLVDAQISSISFSTNFFIAVPPVVPPRVTKEISRKALLLCHHPV